MRTRLGAVRGRLFVACRTRKAAASVSVMVAFTIGLLASAPADAQSPSDPLTTDIEETYGEGLEPFTVDGPLLAVISIGSQHIRVYDRTGLIATSKVSTGRRGNDTPEGIFSIIERKVEHFSNLYDDAEMPFMQRITWSGVALHQGVVPGYRASHGCIRLPKGFAERLFRTSRVGTRVLIVSHDRAPQVLSHTVLPQPGDPAPQPAPPSAETAASPFAGAVRGNITTGVSATAEDAGKEPVTAVSSTVGEAPAVNPEPGFAEIRARRLALERQLAAATAALDEAKLPVRPRLIEQGQAQRALRRALTLANRARGRGRVLSILADRAESETARDEAIAAQLEMMLELVDARSREAEARQLAMAARARARAAQDKVRRLFDKRQQIFVQYQLIQRKFSPFTIFVSRDAGKVFLHQARQPVLEHPIEIRDPDRPLGTHVFIAQKVDGEPDTVSWVGLTLEADDGGAPTGESARSKGKKGRSVGMGHDPLASARAALDRIELPHAVLARVMPTLQPGSTVIISDLGKSIENGPGTDIIVQTKGEAAAARSIAKFQARQRSRAQSWSGYAPSGFAGRRARADYWDRW